MNSVKFRMENFSFKVLKKVKYLFFALKFDRFKMLTHFWVHHIFKSFAKTEFRSHQLKLMLQWYGEMIVWSIILHWVFNTQRKGSSIPSRMSQRNNPRFSEVYNVVDEFRTVPYHMRICDILSHKSRKLKRKKDTAYHEYQKQCSKLNSGHTFIAGLCF
jgi:hypothetical protein